MVKLAQQFNAAGIGKRDGRSGDTARKGWPYAYQRSYVVGRFEKPIPFPCPIYNHKVEQVMRAVVVVPDAGDFTTLTRVSPRTTTLQYNFPPETQVKIGRVKGLGAVLFPDANSALAILGLNGNAFLHWLGSLRIVDELTGLEHMCIVNDGEFIYTTLGVLQRCARDYVLNREAVLAAYLSTRPVKKVNHARNHH